MLLKYYQDWNFSLIQYLFSIIEMIQLMIVIVNKLLAIVINIINEIIKKQKGHRERVGKSGKGYFPIIWGKNPRLKEGAGFELGSPRLESSALAIEPPVPVNSQLINQVHQLH